jgi:hypothetical protein
MKPGDHILCACELYVRSWQCHGSVRGVMDQGGAEWWQGKAQCANEINTTQPTKPQVYGTAFRQVRGKGYLEPVGEVPDTPTVTIGMCHNHHL